MQGKAVTPLPPPPPGFSHTKMILHLPILPKLKATELILQLNNVFNKKYEPNGYSFSYIYGGALTTENFYFPMAGFNFMIGVNLKF